MEEAQMRNHKTMLRVLTVFSFVGFCVFAALYEWSASDPRQWKCLPFAIPFLCFLTLTIRSRRHVIHIKSICAAAVLFAVSVGAAVFFLPNEYLAETRNPLTYHRLLRRSGYPDSVLTEQFPPQIPGDADGTDFYYAAPFLMGGEMMSLRCRMNDIELSELEERYGRMSVWSGTQSTVWEDEKLPVGWIQFPFEEGVSFSNDFTFYLFFCRPSSDQSNEEFRWNHGAYSLAAVSHKQDTIIWQYEQW